MLVVCAGELPALRGVNPGTPGPGEESAAPKLVVRPNLPAGSCGAALPVLTCCCLLWPSQGPDSHYGTKGLRKVIHESPTTGAKTCFTFCYAAGNNNGTSVEDGQIPEIIFYT